MRKILIILVSVLLFIGCFDISDNYIVTDKQIQDPISVFETDKEHPNGYIKTIPRLYILTVKNKNTEETHAIVVEKKIYFKYDLGSEIDPEDIKKE